MDQPLAPQNFFLPFFFFWSIPGPESTLVQYLFFSSPIFTHWSQRPRAFPAYVIDSVRRSPYSFLLFSLFRLDQCKQLCETYDIVYPVDRAHPIRGLQMCTLGELYCQVDADDVKIPHHKKMQLGIDALEKACAELAVTHGPHNDMLKGVRENVSILKEDFA